MTEDTNIVVKLRMWHGATGAEAAAEIEMLRAQVEYLTRIAGCVAVATAVDLPVKTFDDIKMESKIGKTFGDEPAAMTATDKLRFLQECGDLTQNIGKDAKHD